MSKDYYKILDVERNASQDDVKKAFRKQAHKYHPDKEGGDEAKFKEANEAYQILGDEEKRKTYDQFGSAAFENGGAGGFGGRGGFGGAGGFQDLGDLGDIFGDMFGFGGRTKTRAQRGSDIQVDLELTFEEAVFGTDRDIKLHKTIKCERCAGQGAEPGTSLNECNTCKGSGMIERVQRTILGHMRTRAVCDQCGGDGKIPEKQCTGCNGLKVEKKQQTLTVSIPVGIDNGQTIRLRGEGEAGPNGGPEGDLYLRIHVKPSKDFVRQGNTIKTKAEIGFAQAALGDTIEVKTVDGQVDLKIPAGTQAGTEFRLRGKGIASGDQIVTVQVITPKKLSRKQKEMLSDLGI
ncbi:MAG: molecular chaperone DnaJ [Candidatus Uhrbacteria bacterium]